MFNPEKAQAFQQHLNEERRKQALEEAKLLEVVQKRKSEWTRARYWVKVVIWILIALGVVGVLVWVLYFRKPDDSYHA